jgi:hypothetical protein
MGVNGTLDRPPQIARGPGVPWCEKKVSTSTGPAGLDVQIAAIGKFDCAARSSPWASTRTHGDERPCPLSPRRGTADLYN